MHQLDPTQVAARELLAIAQRLGIDLEPLWRDWVFRNENRTIYFWQEGNKYHYTLEGVTSAIPSLGLIPASDSCLVWSESGTIDSVELAVQLLAAWLIERKEADDLPSRHVTSHGVN